MNNRELTIININNIIITVVVIIVISIVVKKDPTWIVELPLL